MGQSARFLSVLLAVLFVTGDLATVAAQPGQGEIVLAQAEPGQRPGIFRFLFRNRRPRLVPMPLAPAPKEQTRQRKKQQAATPSRERRQRRDKKRAAAPAAPVVEAVEKAENAKRVMVVGDFMAGALAKGLNAAYEQSANIVTIDASNGSSGLVRNDFYDWPAAMPVLVAEQKPDVIVALIGANDRQEISTSSGSFDPGTEEWRAAYTARVSAFADALAATQKPVLWAGLPTVRQKAMARDYSAFNGIVRETLEDKGLRFIETWDGFADEEGQFVAVGPDMGGQSVQLRTDDGLNFTRAGQRKLAYFVENDINTILGGAAPVLAAAVETQEAAVPGEAVPKIGPMVPIEALTAGGTELSAAAPAPATKSGAAAAAIVTRLGGETAAVPQGRADDYVWPVRAPPRAPAAAASPAAPATDPAAGGQSILPPSTAVPQQPADPSAP
jgi:hypothetical protein